MIDFSTQVSSQYDQIRDAIIGKQQVVAYYNGLRREMCPHVLGLNKNGEAQCLFYQFGGESSSGVIVEGSPKNWRCITVSKLTNVIVRDGSWNTSANHSRPQTCVRQIDVEVDY